VLVGEHDEKGAPTAKRVVITASYSPDQKLAHDGMLIGPLPMVEVMLTATPVPSLPPYNQEFRPIPVWMICEEKPGIMIDSKQKRTDANLVSVLSTLENRISARDSENLLYLAWVACRQTCGRSLYSQRVG
jgi:hypothetical protein